MSTRSTWPKWKNNLAPTFNPYPIMDEDICIDLGQN
jgi:hypothetical protein